MTALVVFAAAMLHSQFAHAQSVVDGPRHRKAVAFAVTEPLPSLDPQLPALPKTSLFTTGFGNGFSFDGLSNEDNTVIYSLLFAPADQIGAVGPNDYVQTVNSLFRVYDKSGVPRTPPLKLSTLFSALGTTCAPRNDGLPNVVYDQFADRWVISQVCSAHPPFRQMIAVSVSGDPAGRYYAYEFVMPNVKVNDFPKMGRWGNAYTMTTDEFLGADFAGSGIFAFDRDRLLGGDPEAGYIYFALGTDSPTRRRGALPADVDGLVSPLPGTPALFATYTADEYGDPADAIRLWELLTDFDQPDNSMLTEAGGSPIAVDPFDPASPFGRADIAQPPPGEFLDSQSDRIAHRLAYRDFGTHESLVFNQTVRSSQPGAAYRAGLRLYELNRQPGGQFTAVSQADIGDDTSSRWIGSAAQDHEGNTALQYNFVSDEKQVSVNLTGRTAASPPNTLMPEQTIVEGTGVQRAFGWRWGEYSGMSVDPFEGCTFWLTNGFYTLASQQFSELGWLTHIAAFKFDSCSPLETASVSGTVTDAASGQPIENARVRLGEFSRRTDAAGVYGPMVVRPGNALIGASAPGYSTSTLPIVLVPGTQNASFTLQPIPVIVAASTSIAAESCKLDRSADPGETISLEIVLRNDGARTATGLSAVLQAGGGIEAPGPAQALGDLPPGGEVKLTLTFTISTSVKCGTEIEPVLQLAESGVALPALSLKIRTGKPNIVLDENFDGQPAPDLPAGWSTSSTTGHQLWRVSTERAESGANSVFSPAPHQQGVNELVSPPFEIGTASPLITFRNWYELETTFLRNRLYDGAVLEIQYDGGDWQDFVAAGGSFLEGGYDGLIDTCCSNPLGGRPGWSGRSGIYTASEFIETVAALPPSAAGRTVRLRWRISTDIGSFREGQYLDDIVVTDGYTCSCGKPASQAPFDFDGDGRTDLSMANLSNGTGADFRVVHSSTGEVLEHQFGSADDLPANADFDGDGRTDIAVYRPPTGEWWIENSSDGTVRTLRFGVAEDRPVPADFDGDGRADVAVYRPSTGEWHIYRSSDSTAQTVRFGVSEDIPLPADLDGDGRADIAVYRPSNGIWYIFRSSDQGVSYIAFGLSSDRPLTADFDGDGRSDLAVYRPSAGIWYLLNSSAGFSAVRFGTAEDRPLTADFDADGKADIAVFRPSARVWYYLRSSDGGFAAAEFGFPGEIPLPGIYTGP